ncbi:transglutaminase domain-containing protein, partial [Streptomyces sp. OF3]
MSGGTRLTAAAWLATVAAAGALTPLVDEPVGWLAQAALVLAVLGAVGVMARRTPLARPLTLLAQLVTALVLVTVLFVPGTALGGMIPLPASFEQLWLLLGQGADDVTRFATPAPVTDGIRLLLVAGVVLIGLLVDLLAVTFRAAAPAGLPLLALYSVAAGLGQGDITWLWFLAAAAGYLLLLLAEGRDRVTRWGRVFGGPSLGGPARGGPAAGGASSGGASASRAETSNRLSSPVRTGRRIGAAALGLALLVPALLPSLGGGLLDPANNTGGNPVGGTVTAVNPLVALQDSLNQPENRTVLTYITNARDNQDMYLRIVALDQFDGTAWKPAERRIQAVPDPLPAVPGLSPDVARRLNVTSIEAADWYKQNWLPMPYPAQRVEIDGRWRFEPEGRTLVGDHRQTTAGAAYTVASLSVRPTAEQLKNAPEPRPSLVGEYTSVPESLPEVVAETAREVTAGAGSDYERALALQEWFAREGGFRYDTQVRAGSGSAAIARFLEQREGFCVHFAFSMAAMSRTLGIPARVAVGFTPGTRTGTGVYEVGIQDAHAWPEVYFEGVGWTRFEPTPSRGNVPDYARPALPDPSGTDETEPEPEDSTAPAPTPT